LPSDVRRRSRNLAVRIGLDSVEVDELREIIDALTRADIVSRGL
jgi:hypothetical protein